MLWNYYKVGLRRLGVHPGVFPRSSLYTQNVEEGWCWGGGSWDESQLCSPSSLNTSNTKTLFQVIWVSTVGKNCSSPPLSPTWMDPLRSTSWHARKPRSRRGQHLAGTGPHIATPLMGVGGVPERAQCANKCSCLRAGVSWTSCQFASWV